MKRDHSVQTLFGVAAIFTVLGIANLFFGQAKLSHYERLLSAATRDLAITKEDQKHDVTAPTINIDRRTQQIRSLKARTDYYSLVVLGGRCMLAFAGVTLLGILLKRSLGATQAESAIHD